MPTLTVNGARLKIQLVEVELARLKLDPENPRLHSSYLTHELQAQPSQVQLARTLESLPEFESLYNSIAQNNGCFHPPVATADLRVLEGNRRVAALRRLRSENPRDPKWKVVTVEKLDSKLTDHQEKAIRAKFHLDGVLAWDGLSQLSEYLSIAERDGPDAVARMLGRYKNQITPLLVAARSRPQVLTKLPTDSFTGFVMDFSRSLWAKADGAECRLLPEYSFYPYG